MKDSDFVNSSSWPKLTEWCSSCTRTRLVKLVWPREEKVLKEEMFKEVATEGIKKEVIVKEESIGGSTIFTPRSFQSDVFPPSSQPFSQVLGVPFPSSFSTPPCAPYFSPPQCGQTPWPQWVICRACQSWGTVLPCAALS